MDIRIYDHHTRSGKPNPQDYFMHIHNDTYEILYFVSGSASYYVEGNRYRLEHGDLMLMRKGEAHHLELSGSAAYERFLVNFDLPPLPDIDPGGQLLAPFNNRSLGKFNHYSAALFPNNHWRFYLEQICSSLQPQEKLCYLLPLLNDLSHCFETLKNASTGAVKDRCASIVKYINLHLQDDLSLSFLADHFYISKTHLNRIFRHSTGTTVWNYITIKRLFLARELINSGENPTKAYLQCGFQDYNTFYRAYRQHFGVSPKNDTGYIDPTMESLSLDN